MKPPPSWPPEISAAVTAALASGSVSAVRSARARVDALPAALRGHRFRLGVLRTFSVEPLVDHFSLALSCIPVIPEIVAGGLENIEQELFDARSAVLSAAPDAIVVLWRLDELDPQLAWEGDVMSAAERATAAAALNRRLEKLAAGYAGSAPLFLSTLALPQPWIHAPHDRHRPSGVAEVVARFNARVYELAGGGQLRVFDFAQWQAAMGQDAYDAKLELFARQPFSLRGAAGLGLGLARLLAPLATPRAKVLAVDLDNTLWGGVVGEDGTAALHIGHDYPGLIYRRIQQAVRALKHRGVLLVLLSKNNHDDVVAAFEARGDMPLKLSDFSAVKVNWQDKHVNIAAAADELNLGLDSFVFLDDQRFEQEQMRHAQPAVRVLSASGDPLDMLRTLQTCTDFDVHQVSAEDVGRAADYQRQRRRRDEEAVAASRDEFLRGLEMEADVLPVDAELVPRAVQMLAKTNQFNVTSRRHTQGDVLAMMRLPGAILRSLAVRDRFGDQGVVGLAIALPTDAQTIHVDSFLLSCRAIGRGVEDALWAALVTAAQNAGFRYITAEYVRSDKNSQVAELFSRLGMTCVERRDDRATYRMALEAAVDIPAWITVRFREPHGQRR